MKANELEINDSQGKPVTALVTACFCDLSLIFQPHWERNRDVGNFSDGWLLRIEDEDPDKEDGKLKLRRNFFWMGKEINCTSLSVI